MRWGLLRGLFAVMLVAMVGLTVAASLDRDLMTAAGELWPHLWFRATLADAYFAFLTVWLWIASRETTWVGRVVWLGLVLSLGSIAIAAYMLRWLSRTDNLHTLVPAGPDGESVQPTGGPRSRSVGPG